MNTLENQQVMNDRERAARSSYAHFATIVALLLANRETVPSPKCRPEKLREPGGKAGCDGAEAVS
jgi:hypothetical protein